MHYLFTLVILFFATSCTCNLEKPVIESLTSFYEKTVECKNIDTLRDDIEDRVDALDSCDSFDPEKIALIPEVPPGVWSTKSLMCFSVGKKITDSYSIGSPENWKCKNHTDMHALVDICQKI